MTIKAPLDPALFTGIFEREALRLVKHYDFSDDVTVEPLSQSENTILIVDERARAEKYVLRIHSHQLDYHGGDDRLGGELDSRAAARIGR